MGAAAGPKIAKDKLTFYIDVSNPKSFNEAQGAWKDIIGNGSDVVKQNNPSLINSDSIKSFRFNGSNQRAYSFHNSGVSPSIFYSIELLFRMNTLPTNTFTTNNFIYGERQGTNYAIFLYPQSGGKSDIGVCYDDSRYSSSHRSNYSISAGEWVHFVHIGIPYNGNQGKLKYYINGQLDRDEFISADSNGYGFPGQTYIGYDERYGTYSDVEVAFVKHYTRELTADEIQQHYISFRGRYGI
jgi:hypothetical protein